MVGVEYLGKMMSSSNEHSSYFCGGAVKRVSRDIDEYASISVKLRLGRMLLCS
jgi:hypothetical protein